MAYRISPENPGTVELIDALGNVMSVLTVTYDLATSPEGKVATVAASEVDATNATVTGSVSTAEPI